MHLPQLLHLLPLVPLAVPVLLSAVAKVPTLVAPRVAAMAPSAVGTMPVPVVTATGPTGAAVTMEAVEPTRIAAATALSAAITVVLDVAPAFAAIKAGSIVYDV